jgi:hypothetical protein
MKQAHAFFKIRSNPCLISAWFFRQGSSSPNINLRVSLQVKLLNTKKANRLKRSSDDLMQGISDGPLCAQVSRRAIVHWRELSINGPQRRSVHPHTTDQGSLRWPRVARGCCSVCPPSWRCCATSHGVWKTFARELLRMRERDLDAVNPRFLRAELRLFRINIIYRFTEG